MRLLTSFFANRFLCPMWGDLRWTIWRWLQVVGIEPMPVTRPFSLNYFIDAIAFDDRFSGLGGLTPDEPGKQLGPVGVVVDGRSGEPAQRRLFSFAAGVGPKFVPLGLGIDKARLIGQGVQMVYFFFAAPVLPGKLAVEFVDAVEQAAEEDGEVGQFVELLLFFQSGGREEADGEVTVGAGLLVALAGVSDGRPVYKVAGGGDERIAGSQAGLAAAAQGVNGRDAVDAKTAQSFAAAGADAVALPGFVDGQDDVGQVMEAVAEEGEGEAEAVAGFQATM